ncbi:MAG: glucose-6-phosphate dehydrogenase [Planctomycetota bacterium]
MAMQKIKPTVTPQDITCAQVKAQSNALVVFGASGDLTRRKLLISLFELYKRDLLGEQFYLLGCGRKELSDETFREIAQEAIKEKAEDPPSELLKAFTNKLYYTSGDYGDVSLYKDIKGKLTKLNKKHKVDGTHIFYLAVPPFLYVTIVENLCAAGLSRSGQGDAENQARLVVEKPFGRDLKSAIELNQTIGGCFDESQIYRIDHYLGKDTVQNILIFRFANTIFEPVWNRNYIDSVQITIAESIGVEHRASYYDKSGALRDMFQNHVLQMLTLVAMEPPISFEADRLRDEKVKVLRAIRPIEFNQWNQLLVRGRYGPGLTNGEKVPGYLEEPGVDPDSRTETFVAAKLFVDNWRWKGVPFYLRTGKRLARKDTEIAVTFKKIPHSMFVTAGLADVPSNVLILQIQPQEGISLSFQAKQPGSKICMSTLNMNFHYADVFGVRMPEAYQRLLLDCMVGDQTLFNRYDGVETAWKLLTPVLEAWQESFPQADQLIKTDGRKWRNLGPI